MKYYVFNIKICVKIVYSMDSACRGFIGVFIF